MKAIHENAPVLAKMSIRIQASPDKVWQVLSNVNAWPQWQSDISKAEMQGKLQAGSTFIWKSNGAIIKSTLHTVQAPNTLGWTGKSLGINAIHNWYLIADQEYCLVKVEESMEGLLAWLLKGMMNRNLEKGMRNWLELLKKVCEA